MQRTVKEYTFYYADVDVKDDGTFESTIKTVTIRTEYTKEKAFKRAVKKVGYMFKPIKVEAVDRLYIMDDETFFKYAKVKGDDKEKVEEDDKEKVEEDDKEKVEE